MPFANSWCEAGLFFVMLTILVAVVTASPKRIMQVVTVLQEIKQLLATKSKE